MAPAQVGLSVNPRLGWALAATAFAVGWMTHGSRGLVLAATVVAFWLLLQFYRTVRVMQRAAARPVGDVDSAVMLHSKLRRGMPLVEVLQLTGSLGAQDANDADVFEWRDRSGDRVSMRVVKGRCDAWTLHRSEPEAAARDTAP